MSKPIKTYKLCSCCGRPIAKNDLHFTCEFCGAILCEACIEVDELLEAAHAEEEAPADLNEYICPQCFTPCMVHNGKLLKA